MNEMAEMNDNIGATDGISFWINVFTSHSLKKFFFPVEVFVLWVCAYWKLAAFCPL